MDRRQFLLGGLAAATLGAAGLVSLQAPPVPGEKKAFAGVSADERRRKRFPDVVLKTHQGRDVRFYDDLVRGKTVLINFFYTNCVGEALCPTTTANLVKVQELLGKRVGRDVFLYSISLDPGHDTPKVLNRYAKGFGVKPGWLFLTGAAEDIESLRRSVGFVDPDPVRDRDRSQHIGMVRYGIEPLERWASCPCLSSPKWIVKYLSWMEPEGERPSPWPPKGPARPVSL
ncbi:MAG: SCO family protein [Deltaproteobacteria bacterium]|nr:SCO family protein [Deltaproteobacteria bacterium]PWB61457.1 MAG: SCO family protein [Deltaproteobacteria bacterium]